MPATVFDTRASEWAGDLARWLNTQSADNSAQRDRLCRRLRQAREEALTPRQRQVLSLYFDQGLTIPQIAGALDVNRSTVSRTLRRARDRLGRCLQYAL